MAKMASKKVEKVEKSKKIKKPVTPPSDSAVNKSHKSPGRAKKPLKNEEKPKQVRKYNKKKEAHSDEDETKVGKVAGTEEKSEEIEVTIEYLNSAKKDKPESSEEHPIEEEEEKPEIAEVKIKGKRGKPAKKKEGETSVLKSAIKTPKASVKKTLKKDLLPYVEKDTILSLLSHLKSSNYEDLLRIIEEQYLLDSEFRVRLDLAALERSGVVTYSSAGRYELYNDIVLDSYDKTSVVKPTVSEIKEAKSSKKKTPATSGRKGRPPSKKKSLAKEKEIIEEVEEVEASKKKVDVEEIEEEEDNIKAEEDFVMKPASAKKSEKKTLINLEQEEEDEDNIL